jgi:hypothetical protein
MVGKKKLLFLSLVAPCNSTLFLATGPGILHVADDNEIRDAHGRNMW